MGISSEVIGRIFDPFFTSKAIGVGTGLGLANCQRLVTDMGGELSVTSEVGKSANFRLARAREFLAVTAVEHIEKPFEPGNLHAFVQR